MQWPQSLAKLTNEHLKGLMQSWENIACRVESKFDRTEAYLHVFVASLDVPFDAVTELSQSGAKGTQTEGEDEVKEDTEKVDMDNTKIEVQPTMIAESPEER